MECRNLEKFVFQGTPEPGSGVAIPSNRWLFQFASDPKAQAAISEYERAALGGRPSAVRMMVVKQCRHHLATDRAAAVQARAIEIAARKAGRK